MVLSIWHPLDRHDVIPANIRQAVDFPLYQPTWLPEGFIVDSQSFDVTSQVVTFTVSNSQTRSKLIFTEQPKPAQFDFNSFYDEQLTEKRSLTSPSGQATIGLFEGSLFASVLTDRTWVLIRVPGSQELTQFERVLQYLTLAS